MRLELFIFHSFNRASRLKLIVNFRIINMNTFRNSNSSQRRGISFENQVLIFSIIYFCLSFVNSESTGSESEETEKLCKIIRKRPHSVTVPKFFHELGECMKKVFPKDKIDTIFKCPGMIALLGTATPSAIKALCVNPQEPAKKIHHMLHKCWEDNGVKFPIPWSEVKACMHMR